MVSELTSQRCGRAVDRRHSVPEPEACDSSADLRHGMAEPEAPHGWADLRGEPEAWCRTDLRRGPSLRHGADLRHGVAEPEAQRRGYRT